MPRVSKEKNREYQAKWYKNHKEIQFARIKSRQKELAQKLTEYKSKLKCEICGESHPSCIDFHHRDPDSKEFDIGWSVNRGRCWDKILKEIGKCQVLCSNCHRKLHWTNTGK